MLYTLREGFTDPSDPESFAFELRANLNIFSAPINPLFSQWLKSEPKTLFNEVLSDIATLLGYFEYGKLPHILRHVSIECEPSFSRMILRNYCDFSLDSVNGHCGEVNEKAYILIRHKYPTINMLRVQGQRGGFSSGWNHWFLLISKHPFRSKGSVVFTPDFNQFDSSIMDLPDVTPLRTGRLEHQLSGDIYVGDASAGTVTELDLSSYVLTPPCTSSGTMISRLEEDSLSLLINIEQDSVRVPPA
jgi:hypothetical protein